MARPVAVLQIALKDDEVPAMDYAGPRVVGPSKYQVIWTLRSDVGAWASDGHPILELYFDDGPLSHVRKRGEALYSRMRDEARLAPAPARIVGLFQMLSDEQPSGHFLDEVYEMLDQQRFEWAVVAAQVTCEVKIRSAIERRSQVEPGSLGHLAIKHLRSYSLMDRQGQDVFRVVLGAAPTTAPCWEAYREHVTRRNGVVHLGARVTREDAQASLDVMLNFLAGLVPDP